MDYSLFENTGTGATDDVNAQSRKGVGEVDWSSYPGLRSNEDWITEQEEEDQI